MLALARRLLVTPSTLSIWTVLVLLPLAIYASSLVVRSFVRLLSWHLRQRNDARRRILLSRMDIREHEKRRTIVGFFHPYCNAGGGGERVLWAAIAYMQRTEPDVICVVYTGDSDASEEQIIAKVEARFSIELDPKALSFVFLEKRWLVEDAAWPRFTLLGQSLGSMVLGYEALSRLIPDIFIDTMGYAFALDVVRWLTKCPIGAYVHYPTISSTMVQRVQSRASGHTNNSSVAGSSILSYVKLLYYIIFTELYSLSLRQANYTMVNSSWTHGHIQRLLQPLTHRDDEVLPEKLSSTTKQAHIVYPPCDCTALAKLPLEVRETIILSIAQFRPEKEHTQQLYALRSLLDLPKSRRPEGVRLILAGSVRNAGDEARVQQLRQLAKDLDIETHTQFALNVPYPELVKLYGRASIGISTMVDEHFGINVVEMMAAGLIPVVHASGGPKLDILAPGQDGQLGFWASSPNDFADALSQACNLSASEQLAMRYRARRRATEKFDTAAFEQGWQKAWEVLRAVQK